MFDFTVKVLTGRNTTVTIASLEGEGFDLTRIEFSAGSHWSDIVATSWTDYSVTGGRTHLVEPWKEFQ